MAWECEQIGACTLYRGDCREVLPIIPAVEALVTDPPYGVNLGKHAAAKEKRNYLAKQAYGSYEDTPENFVKIIVPAVRQALQHVQRGVVFVADTQMWEYPKPAAVGAIYLPSGKGRNCWGFQCLSHYLLYGKAPALERGAQPMAFTSTVGTELNEHPCAKPLQWMSKLVDLVSLPTEGVVDPFMGSGTTGVACVQLERSFIGIEIDRRYFDLACRRIEAASRQGILFSSALSSKVCHQSRLFA